MREKHGLGRSFQCVQRGLIPAMRQIHGHADFLHTLEYREPENRESAIALFEKSTADPIVEIVCELRDALAHGPKCVNVRRFAKMRGILQRQHDADLPGLLCMLKTGYVIYAQNPVAVRRTKSVPVGEVSECRGVIWWACTKCKYVDPRLLKRRGIRLCESARLMKPLVVPGKLGPRPRTLL